MFPYLYIVLVYILLPIYTSLSLSISLLVQFPCKCFALNIRCCTYKIYSLYFTKLPQPPNLPQKPSNPPPSPTTPQKPFPARQYFCVCVIVCSSLSVCEFAMVRRKYARPEMSVRVYFECVSRCSVSIYITYIYVSECRIACRGM